MKNENQKESMNIKIENKLKDDKTLYEKLLIIGDKESGKSSLIQNIFYQESISMISDSIISQNSTNINKNNEVINNIKTSNNNNIENQNENKNIDNIENKNENNIKKENNDNNIKIELANKSENNIISEQKISIKNENKKLLQFQIFESSFFDSNIIHSFVFMCKCIIIIFDVKNMNSFVFYPWPYFFICCNWHRYCMNIF